jgi:ribosomal protein S18 acetylase RimI-like enzyme
LDAPKPIHFTTREIDPAHLADVKTITQMHISLLSWGPLSNLGRIFLQRFCYTVLIGDDLMRAALCFVNGQPAGFVAYTAQSYTFHRTALKKHWPLVIYLAFLSILKKPPVLFKIIKALRVMVARQTENGDPIYPTAEILAIGVWPEFRRPQFIHKTGFRLSHELFGLAVRYFKSVGLTGMRLTVDAFNKEAILFYLGLGGRMEKKYRRAGDLMVEIRFDLKDLTL